MSTIISEELLSLVVGRKVTPIHVWDSNLEYSFMVNSIKHSQSINIYELAHKCKEWACDNDWFIYERKTPIGIYEYSALHRNGSLSPSYNDLYILCEWILENKDNK